MVLPDQLKRESQKHLLTGEVAECDHSRPVSDECRGVNTRAPALHTRRLENRVV